MCWFSSRTGEAETHDHTYMRLFHEKREKNLQYRIFEIATDEILQVHTLKSFD
jgi:hypothetical protein